MSVLRKFALSGKYLMVIADSGLTIADIVNWANRFGPSVTSLTPSIDNTGASSSKIVTITFSNPPDVAKYVVGAESSANIVT